MSDFVVEAYITETGELRIELPAGIPSGKVWVTIATDNPDAALTIPPQQPATGHEIVQMLRETDGFWQDTPVADGAAWTEALRNRAKARRHQQWSE